MALWTRASIVAVTLLASMSGCHKFIRNLNEGLEDEKSNTRHAMEAYRKESQGPSPEPGPIGNLVPGRITSLWPLCSKTNPGTGPGTGPRLQTS